MNVVALDTRDRAPDATGVDPSEATRPLEMVAAAGGFVLVVAAQWAPWFQVHTVRSVVNPATVPSILSHGSIDAIDAANTLTVPYYLGWFVVFGLCGATVFGTTQARRICGPIGLGALAAQALVVISIVHTRGVASADAASMPPGVSVGRASGTFLVLAALVLLGLAMIGSLAARVRSVTARDMRAGMMALAPRRRVAERVVLAGSDADALDDDPPAVAYGRFTPVAMPDAASSSEPPMAMTPPAPDHSLYRRPVGDMRPDAHAAADGHAAPDAPTHAVARG